MIHEQSVSYVLITAEKFKLPIRSSSFKDKDDPKKKKAFVEPLVRAPSDVSETFPCLRENLFFFFSYVI